MPRFALINNYQVMEVITDTEEFAVSLAYESTIPHETAQPGWTYTDGVLSPPVVPGEPQPPLVVWTLDMFRDALKGAATEQRWMVETSGITLGGILVGTTIADQNRIASVLLSPVTQVDFKATSGWVTLDIETIRAIAAAIAAHVQACFSAERAHHAAIDALSTIAAAQAYDVTTGWPNA